MSNRGQMQTWNPKKIYRTVTIMGINRFQDALTLRFGPIFSIIIIRLVKYLAVNLPLSMINFVPKSLCSLFAGASLLENSSKDRCFLWSNRAGRSKFSGHQKVAFFVKISYAFKNLNDIEFKKYINDEVLGRRPNQQNLDFYKVWSFHNANQVDNVRLLSILIKNLEQSDIQGDLEPLRYLPEHTTNMGHLSLLFFYANFYRVADPKREIAIWPEISPNKFYLQELLKIFPLPYKLISGVPDISTLKNNQIDTLQYSRLRVGKWRYEVGSCLPCAQDFPEYLVSEAFKLKSNEDFTDNAFFELQKINFDKKKWFVILHIKEHSMGYSFGGETRDAAISTYRKCCELINSLGGQVVRMGGPNFPKLQQGFPAIDYAHSRVRSEKLDYWLWANCKFWIGNGNGASFAVMPFKKPRLVTNVWPINSFGPIYDIYMPKIIFDNKNNKLLSPEELFTIKLSRSMKKDLFRTYSLSLIDNSPELLKDATLEMYNLIESEFQNKPISYSKFELEINKSIMASPTTPVMRIPRVFQEFIDNNKAK
jgi:putative glycosyltransferase (TIGR04372 family)